MTAEAEFFERNARWFPHGVYPDDDDDDKIALVVTDEFPIETINKILKDNIDLASAPWLVNSYEGAPVFHDGMNEEGTYPPVDATWISPFIGKSLQEVASWICDIPKPPTSINKTFFAVLQKELYEKKSQALICKITDDGELQTIPTKANAVGPFAMLFRREEWDESFENQRLEYI